MCRPDRRARRPQLPATHRAMPVVPGGEGEAAVAERRPQEPPTGGASSPHRAPENGQGASAAHPPARTVPNSNESAFFGTLPRSGSHSSSLGNFSASLFGRRGSDMGTPRTPRTPRPEDGVLERADWPSVLKVLQTEKKRSEARDGEHYVNRALFCLSPAQPLREKMVKLAEWDFFNNAVLFLIALNCIFLILENPVCKCAKQGECTEQEVYRQDLLMADCTHWPQTEMILTQSELIFTVLFTVECMIKIIARGFILHKHAYLRDVWNWLDFVVVISSVISVLVQYVGEAEQLGAIQFLRTVRVFRPLRTMKRIKGMRPLINTLAKAFENLGKVLFLLSFFFIVFAILGHELFVGKLHGRCYVDPSNRAVFTDAAYSRFISQQVPFLAASTVNLGAWNGGEGLCGDDSACDDVVVDGIAYPAVCSLMKYCYDENTGFGWRECKSDWNGNPYEQGGGLMSFDNILQSLLIVFQVVTVEGWVDQLALFMGADAIPALPIIYFVLVVILGTFFVLQLLLALLSESYTQAQAEEESRIEAEALNVQALLKQPSGNKRKTISWKQRIRNFVQWFKGKPKRVAPNSEDGDWPIARTGTGGTFDSSDHSAPAHSPMQAVSDGGLIRKRQRLARKQSFIAGKDSVFVESLLSGITAISAFARPIIMSSLFINMMNVAILLNAALMGTYHHSELYYESRICERRCELDPNLPANASQYCNGPLYNRTWDDDGSGRGTRPSQRAFCFLEQDELVWPEHKHDSCSQHTTRDACESATARTGIGCYFVEEGEFTEWAYAIKPGCKLGLYDSNSFAESAPFLDGMSIKLGLREICGDDNDGCDAFPKSLETWLENANNGLTMLFLIEMLLRMAGLGLEEYFADSFNTFDCAVVSFSLLEIFLMAAGVNSKSGLSALRGLRLLRLFKLARSWKEMRMILSALGHSLGDLFYTTILLLIFLYIAALLGMTVFGGIQNGNGLRFSKTDVPRSNFDSFFPSQYGHGALVVTFQIISGENWNVIMYNVMTNSPRDGQPAQGINGLNALVPMIVVFFGNYIIMNVFIAILLSGFVEKEANDEDDEETRKYKNKKGPGRVLRFFNKLLGTDRAKHKHVFAPIGTLKSYRETRKMVDHLMVKCYSHGAGGCTLVSTKRQREHVEAMQKRSRKHVESEAPPMLVANRIKVSVRGFPGKTVSITDHDSFMILSPLNRFRVWCAWIAHSKIFDNFILICILITTITLVFVEAPEDILIAQECPSPPNVLDCTGPDTNYAGHVGNINCPRETGHAMFGKKFEACDSQNSESVPECCAQLTKVSNLLFLDQIFAIIFLMELLLKLVADGLVLHPLAYMRDLWNLLDLAVVIISLLTAFATGEGVKQFKVLRAFRAMRPLRAVKRFPSLKVAAECLLASIPSMLNVLLVVLVWICMYSMLGVQLYRGMFFRCENIQDQLFYGTSFAPLSSIYVPRLPLSGPDSVPSIIECVSAGQVGSGDSLVSNGIWQPRDYSFDNVLAGVLILIETSTTEGWLDLMAMCTDTVDTGVTPIPNNQAYVGTIFAVVHVFLGAFVLWNLIVADVISNYMKVKAENDGVSPFLTQEQEDWKRIVRLIMTLKPRQSVHGPAGKFRKRIYDVVHHSTFDLVVTAVICINVITMMFDVHDQSDCTITTFFWINSVFTVFFMIEATLKLAGLGPRWYFVDTWNLFDFLVVVASIFTLGLDYVSGEYTCAPVEVSQTELMANLSSLGILRAVRILRVLRLVRRVKGIRDLLNCLIDSLPSLASVSGLLILMMTIFAVMGVNLFWNVNPGQDIYGNVGEAGGYNTENYRTWGGSMLMLMRQTTGEAWNYVMYYCMQVRSGLLFFTLLFLAVLC